MIALVTGGAASGKSAYAERVAYELGGSLMYFATMSDVGPEAARRIERHRRLRLGKGFATIECAKGFATALRQVQLEGATVLLEDLDNFVANEMYALDGMPRSTEYVLKAVLQGLYELATGAENLVVVVNELGCDGVRYSAQTRSYIELVGQLSCILAARADAVVEVVAHCPLFITQSKTL